MIGASREGYGRIENDLGAVTSVEDIKLMVEDSKVCQLPACGEGPFERRDKIISLR